MDVQAIRSSVDKFGVQATVHDLAYRAANKITELMVLKGIALTMDTLDRKLVEDDAGMRWGFVDRNGLVRSLAHGAGEDMDARFIDEALERGDRCYGAFDGDILASYGWYSTRPTAVNDELVLRFDPRWAYMYKGYTLPAYRGKRLHGIGMGQACQALVGEGLSGLVSYVKSNNFPSLKSCYRLGYQDFGQVFVVKLGRDWHTWATKGCAAYAFRVEPSER